ncbi:uncharacterized protein LOC128739755 [Sabethes cyaneus]|uniref:uncharacterized protein LOC128739755 n=1 Tax=Sabethes cyaneus TaxID=53552 RepID=UPI00237DC2FD|nr:uncharacterized protein LOC128739755 [Sabethes cyaneus]
MATISCECHEGHPAESCGDFLCPPVTNSNTPIQHAPELAASKSESGSFSRECNSRVDAIRRLFEERTDRTSSDRALVEDRSISDLADWKPVDHRRAVVANRTYPESLGNDTSKIYRSHTQIVDIPNGVKIITTILIDDNLEPEEPSVFETVIYPESDIIKRFQLDCEAIVKRS